MRLRNLLVVHGLRSIVNNDRVEPNAQAGIIIEVVRVSIADFIAGATVGCVRTAIFKD